MKQFVLVLVCSATVACASQDPRITKAPGDRLHPAHVDGFPPLHCRAEASGQTRHALCERTPYLVRATVIPAEPGLNGLPAFCIAYMPYNRLTIHTGTVGQATTVKWTLEQGSAFGFAGTGVAPIKGSESDMADLFEPAPIPLPSPIPTPTPTLKKEVTRSIKARAPVGKEVHHLPVVQYWDGSRLVPCVGVDPIIINSAD